MSQPLLITVNGTGCPGPFDPGFSGDIGRAFAYDPWQALAANRSGVKYGTPLYWQPVGYPAAVLPMGKSVEAGRAEVNRLLAMHERSGLCPPGWPFYLSGYSQGAIVTGEVLAKDILDPAGAHHGRLKDCRGVINFGDPLRCPGLARGNEIAKLPAPKELDKQTTGGIAGPACLTAEQSELVYSCALDGDLYACAPVGADPWHHEPEVGKVETRIYQFIQNGSLVKGLWYIAEGIAEECEMPVSHTIAHMQAIINGLKFAAAGTAAPHWQYGPFVAPLIEWVRQQI